jgi:hypothetical protein
MEAVASDRKMRLFACACVRRVWHLNSDDRLERILLGVEDFADGRITTDELEPLNELAWAIEECDSRSFPTGRIACDLANASAVKQPGHPYSGPLHGRHGVSSTAAAAFGAGYCGENLEAYRRARTAESGRQTLLARDIFGNPFRSVAFSPAWRTNTAVLLARQMHDSREFSAMPILADALQDAGCDSDAILSHCRDTNQAHVRGCWVVDQVLGKS